MMVVQDQAYANKIIWIIGASSGIGKALATELAARGAVICLSARRHAELEQLRACLAGEKHQSFPLNVCDQDAVLTTAHNIHTHFGYIDSVLLLSAAYDPMRITALDIGAVRQIIETNLLSAFYVLHAVVPLLQQQAHGQIALCGSVAGYFGLPGGQPYSATKAAIINLAESLRCELAESIDVKIINPGFVKTGLTEKNRFKMPLIITPEKAAIYIADALLHKKFEIHFPKKLTVLLKLIKLLPYGLSVKIAARLNGKGKA